MPDQCDEQTVDTNVLQLLCTCVQDDGYSIDLRVAYRSKSLLTRRSLTTVRFTTSRSRFCCYSNVNASSPSATSPQKRSKCAPAPTCESLAALGALSTLLAASEGLFYVKTVDLSPTCNGQDQSLHFGTHPSFGLLELELA